MAENPPFGAVFTYYLKEGAQTRQEARREKEKEIEEEGGDTPYPGWEEIRKEELEEKPAMLITVRDTAGNVVRRLAGPIGSGFHRIAWDLRYPSSGPWTGDEDPDEDPDDDGSGYLAAPGTYSVSLARRQDGKVTDLGLQETFEVVPMREGTLPGAPPSEVAAFLQELGALQGRVRAAGAAIDAAMERVNGIKQALMRSTTGGTGLDDEARRIGSGLQELRDRINGVDSRDMANDPGPISISRRLAVASMGNSWSTYGPTPTHRRSMAIAGSEFGELGEALERILGTDLPALEEKLDAAGVPWTPGRIPTR